MGDAIARLWELGRDDDRELHRFPGHALRVLEDLSEYVLPLGYSVAVFDFVAALTTTSTEMDDHKRSPLELLRPLLRREGTTLKAHAFGIQSGSYQVSASATADLRRRVRTLLVDHALHASPRNRLLAAELLVQGLALPRGFFGQQPPREWVAAMAADQAEMLDAIASVIQRSDDVYVRHQFQSALKRQAGSHVFPELAELADHAQQRNLTSEDELLSVLRSGFHWRTDDAVAARLSAVADRLAARDDAAEVASELDELVRGSNEYFGDAQANASALLVAVADRNPQLGAGLAQW